MINLLKDIPYEKDTPGRRFIVNREDLRIVQVALRAGQSVPRHTTDGNVNVLVLRGNLDVSVDNKVSQVSEGFMIPIAADTPMQVINASQDDAAFMIIKTPKPGARFDTKV